MTLNMPPLSSEDWVISTDGSTLKDDKQGASAGYSGYFGEGDPLSATFVHHSVY